MGESSCSVLTQLRIYAHKFIINCCNYCLCVHLLLQTEPATEPVVESNEDEKPATTAAVPTTAAAGTAAATDAEAGEVVTGKSGLEDTVSAAVVQEVNAATEKVTLLLTAF
jgi:hypothetical protein